MTQADNTEPSKRWLSSFLDAFMAAGGWTGDWTMRCLRPYAVDLWRAGASTRVAGLACAQQYRQHKEMTQAVELARSEGAFEAAIEAVLQQ